MKTWNFDSNSVICQSAYRWKQTFLSYICMYAYICIRQSGISSWNSNTSLLKNRPGCWLLSFPFRPVLNTQTSMLMGNPWGPATFVTAPKRMSLSGHWVTAASRPATGQAACCQILISVASRRMPAGRWAPIGIWWAEDWRLSWFPFLLVSVVLVCDAPGGGLVCRWGEKWECVVVVTQQVVCVCRQRPRVNLIDYSESGVTFALVSKDATLTLKSSFCIYPSNDEKSWIWTASGSFFSFQCRLLKGVPAVIGHLFKCLYGLRHSTLQGGRWERRGGLSLICWEDIPQCKVQLKGGHRRSPVPWEYQHPSQWWCGGLKMKTLRRETRRFKIDDSIT